MVLGSNWALSRAKDNVERAYPVVGVLEELDTTLAVLEDKLPRFFKGVQELYNRISKLNIEYIFKL